MKSISTLVNGFQSTVTNGRTHGIVIDLPPAKDGSDLGPTALELAVMGLSGCISTIFAVVASKMRLPIDSLVVELEADHPEGAPTITKVRADVKIKSEAVQSKLEKCLERTLDLCPVGKLFEQANIPIDVKIIKL